MKDIRALVALLVLLIGVIGSVIFEGTRIISNYRAESVALRAVTKGINQFRVELYDVICKANPNQNLIVSPLNIATVMGMVQAGARGKTADAIRRSLHFPSDEQINSGFRSLHQQLRTDGNVTDGNVTLVMANVIYASGGPGFSINPSFADTLKTYFSANPHPPTIDSESDQGVSFVNDFLTKTNPGRFIEISFSSDLETLARLVLASAVYFKGTWKHQFPKEDTSKMPFHTSEGNKVNVDMMRLEDNLLYADIREMNARAVSLPYKGDRFSMVILLPNEQFGLSALEDKLKKYTLKRVLEKMKKREVNLYLPKFKIESTIDLKDPLSKLGLSQIFDSYQANFSGVGWNSEQAYVSKVVQSVFIEVNEEGAETTAATGYGVRLASNTRTLQFVVDHPFKFAIYYKEEMELTLLEGRVEQFKNPCGWIPTEWDIVAGICNFWSD